MVGTFMVTRVTLYISVGAGVVLGRVGTFMVARVTLSPVSRPLFARRRCVGPAARPVNHAHTTACRLATGDHRQHRTALRPVGTPARGRLAGGPAHSEGARADTLVSRGVLGMALRAVS